MSDTQHDSTTEEYTQDGVPTEAGTQKISATRLERPGTVIGRYTLVRELGTGGFGAVYLAQQEEPVRRQVALKIIKLGMDTRQVVARFEAERQALAMMDHPGIAKVLDAGATETGRPYFVMELVEGTPIKTYCDKQRLNLEQRLRLFMNVCAAVQHAHQKGIIHRDIKPNNIMVAQLDGEHRVKVIDFGIAKATQEDLTDKTVVTRAEGLMGTPAYMSPEQTAGGAVDIDTRTDIYSLGVVLYELLIGRTPLDNEELLLGGYEAIRRRVQEEEATRPSTRLQLLHRDDLRLLTETRRLDLKQLHKRLRGELDWIVLKALEKERDRRYATANAFRLDLERLLNNEPVLACPPSTVYLFAKLVRRNRLAFAAAFAVVAALAIGMGVATQMYFKERESFRLMAAAEREQNRLREEAVRARERETQLREEAVLAQRIEAQLRARAEAQELETRRIAYAADISLAQVALEAHNMGRALELLNRNRPRSGQEDLRGWEWRYLWSQCRSDAMSEFYKTSSAVYSMDMSHDGSLLAVGEYPPGKVTVWDYASREKILDVRGHRTYGARVAFSPTEPLLAYTYYTIKDGKWRWLVVLWDAAKREIRAELPLSGICRGLVFSPEGSALITVALGSSRGVTLWRVADAKQLRTFPGRAVSHAMGTPWAIAPDAGAVAFVSPANQINLYDLDTGEELWSAVGAEEKVTALEFSPDGGLLCSGAGYAESAVRLWDARSGEELDRLEGHGAWVSDLVFWPDGRIMASASADQSIRLWDMTSRRPIGALRGNELEVWSLRLLDGGNSLASGSKDGSLKIWSTERLSAARGRSILTNQTRTFRFTTDSRSVLTLEGGNQLTKRSVEDPGTAEDWLRFASYPALSKNGLWAIDLTETGGVRLWDVTARSLARELKPIPDLSRFAWVADDGASAIYVTSTQRAFRRLDLETAQVDDTLSVDGSLNYYAVNRERILAVTSGGDWTLKDLASGQIGKFRHRMNLARALALSPGNDSFALAHEPGGVSLWLGENADEGLAVSQSATITGSLMGVHSLLFSADGRRLVAGSAGHEAIRLWDTATRQDLLTLGGRGSIFVQPAYSSDGSILGAINSARQLHLWRAPTWEEIAEAEANSNR